MEAHLDQNSVHLIEREREEIKFQDLKLDSMELHVPQTN